MTTITTPLSPDHESIAVRAYYLWEAEGCPEGRHTHHWLTAEAAEKRSLVARRSAATRRAKQMAAPTAAPVVAPKATPAAVVAAAAVTKTRATSSRAARRVH